MSVMPIKKMTPDIAKTLSLAEQHEWFTQRHSRRAMLKGGLLGAASLVAGPAVLSRTAQVVDAAGRTAPTLLASTTPAKASGVVPFGRHISFGPDPSSEMRNANAMPTDKSATSVTAISISSRVTPASENLGGAGCLKTQPP